MKISHASEANKGNEAGASGLARASPASQKNQSLDKKRSLDKIHVQEKDILCKEGSLSLHSIPILIHIYIISFRKAYIYI